MPIGTPLTFVSDSTVDDRAEPGHVFHVHLKNDLTLPGSVPTLLAAAGAPADLRILARERTPEGTTRYTIGLSRFELRTDAGELPVAPLQAHVENIHPGLEIPATTQGAVGIDDTGRIRVAIPIPFTLPNDSPSGAYTPLPLKTPPIFIRDKVRRGSPPPSTPPLEAPSAAPSPSPSAAPESPAPSATP